MLTVVRIVLLVMRWSLFAACCLLCVACNAFVRLLLSAACMLLVGCCVSCVISVVVCCTLVLAVGVCCFVVRCSVCDDACYVSLFVV